MKPYLHSKSSAKKYGGIPEDYLDIHDFMDSTKAGFADVRHRAILHSSFGCYIVEKIFGHVRKNSSDKEYSVRDIAEQHVIEDLGYIPSTHEWLECMELKTWMGGKMKRTEVDLTKPFDLYEEKSKQPNHFPESLERIFLD